MTSSCSSSCGGDHNLNEIKVGKLPGLDPFRFATDAEIVAALGCKPGYIGPVGIDASKVRIIADRTVAAMSDFVCGANAEGFHLIGVILGPRPAGTVAGGRHPQCRYRRSLAGRQGLARPVPRHRSRSHFPVAHQIRRKRCSAPSSDEQGKEQVMEMGCYGIGVSRIVGAAIEQGNDERGIVFPAAIAPFEACIVPMGYHKSDAVRAAADKLLADLKAAGIDVVLDDRNERPGVMFADMELIGIPHRIVVGERGLKEGQLEYKGRRDADVQMIPAGDALAFLREKLCA